MASPAKDRIDGPEESCARCRYYEPIGQVQKINCGECRVRAPFIVGTAEFRKEITDDAVWASTRWPIVAHHHYCGQWAAKGRAR
ncbi:MAG: hypothetical protein ACK5XA_08530 [Tagaea sp.]